MIYVWKSEGIPLITNELLEESDVEKDELELIFATENIEEVKDYLKYYYNYSDLEVDNLIKISSN